MMGDERKDFFNEAKIPVSRESLPSAAKQKFKYKKFEKEIFRQAESEVKRWYPSLERRIFTKGRFPNNTNVLFFQINRAIELTPYGAVENVSDKLSAELRLKKFGVATTNTVAIWDGYNLNLFGRVSHSDTEYFAKPNAGAGGKGAFIYTGAPLPPGKQYLIQERVQQAEETARFNPSCLNTLRVLTYRRTGGAFRVIAATLRMGVGDSPVDNASSGGIFCTLDPTSGALAGLARSMSGAQVASHPTTGLQFSGAVLKSMPQVASVCEAAHDAFPSRPCLAWDVALTPSGPIIVEITDFFMQLLISESNWRPRVLKAFLDDHKPCEGGFTAEVPVDKLSISSVVRAEISVGGVVQGVGFRKGARREADKLNLIGKVENCLDGSVRIEVFGKISSLEIFVQKLRSCARSAKVSKIDAKVTEVLQDRSFEIVRP